MPIIKKTRLPSLSVLICVGALLLATWVYINPPKARQAKEMLITCFVGSEPFYSGPIRKRPLVRDGSVFITLGDEASLEFINGTCIIFSSPD